MSKNPLYRTLLGFFGVVAFFSIVMYSSGDVRDWFQANVALSEVRHAQVIGPQVIPVKDSLAPYLEFFAVGDAGTGGAGQQLVAEAMGRVATEDPISFVLFLGDNFYESGVSSVTDPQWKTKFEDMYSAKSLQVPFYAVLGNHDYGLNPNAQVKYTRKSKRWKMPSHYYTFTRRVDDSTTIQFFCLDSYPIAQSSVDEIKEGKDKPESRLQRRWLERKLAASRARWKVVLGHHPIYSNGMHGNDPSMAAALEGLLEKYNVDFYLAGHDHNLELLKPLNGVNYVVSGAGGKHRDVEWRDNTVFAATNLGFTMFRISHRQAILEFLNRDGKQIFAETFDKALRKPPVLAARKKTRR